MADERYRRYNEDRRDDGRRKDDGRSAGGRFRDYGLGLENDASAHQDDEGPAPAYRSQSYGHARERSGGTGRPQEQTGSGYGLSGALGPGYTGRGGDADYGGQRGRPGQNYGREHFEDPERGGSGRTGGYSGIGGGRDDEGIGRSDPADPGGEHRGRGPRGYQRSDQRIAEDVSDRLTDDPSLNASDIACLSGLTLTALACRLRVSTGSPSCRIIGPRQAVT